MQFGIIYRNSDEDLHPFTSAEDGNINELYFLSKDPKEIKNLIKSPEAALQLKEMKRFLDEALEQYKYFEPPSIYKAPEAVIK